VKGTISPQQQHAVDITPANIMRLPKSLKQAVLGGDVQKIEAYLTKRPAAERPSELDICLTLAMPHGCIPVIKRLVELGAQLNIFSLGNAMERGEHEVLQILVDSGSDINSTEFESGAIQ
jgi:hypothetical protein